jgi:D-sedoheptulose 7-phosphate isomerase
MQFGEYVDLHHLALESVDELSLSRFKEAFGELRESGATLWVAGNGGSSATASHAVADLTKTITQMGGRGIKCVSLSEMVSLQTAFANDNSFVDAMYDSLQIMGSNEDALLIFSVSGRSPNLIRAATAAKEIGMTVMSVVGALGDPIVELSDISLKLESEDYQVVENIHMMIVHWWVKTIL